MTVLSSCSGVVSSGPSSPKLNPALFCEDTEARHRLLRPSTVIVNGRPALCSSVPLLKAMVTAVLEVERG